MDKSGEMFGIWLGVGIACMGAAISIFGGMSAFSIVVMFTIMTIGALLATALVFSDQLIAGVQAIRTEQTKAKRGPEDKVAMLREMLDDDEWDEFKATLKAQVLDGSGVDAAGDGEISLAELVDSQDSTHAHHG